jgi:hypothetical protein
MNYIKMSGQGSGVTRLAQGEMSCGDGPEWEGEMRWGKKSSPVVGNWAKELTGHRNGFLISRIEGLNEIRSNSNGFYLKSNSRAHINTKINAS